MTERTCAVEDCNRPSYCRGWCTRHYQRWRAHGTVEDTAHSNDVPWPQRLARYYTEGDPEECWPWTGDLTPNGYGQAPADPDGVRHTAHRAVYLAHVGPLNDDEQVDHTCHDPSLCREGDACPHRRCVNRGHLAATTVRENALRSNGVGAVNAAKQTCTEGHPYDAVTSRGRRVCRKCAAAWARNSRARKRAPGLP